MRRKFYLYLSIIFVISLLSSCITNKEKTYLQADKYNSKYKMEPYEQYKLCVNDEITFFLMTADVATQYLYNGGLVQGGVSNSSNSYRIYDDGTVVLPTIGRVKIIEMTVRQAEIAITEAFKNVVVDDAEVKVALVNNYFYVQGDHGKGQFFIYKEKLNIFQALAMAGDISITGDKNHIKIIRRGADGMDHVKTLDLRQESIVESEYYYVYPNDVIYIPTISKSFFRVDSAASFISMFVGPISLLVLVMSLF